MLPSKSWHHDMTTEKISEMEHGKGHVTATTVPRKLQQWDRYRVTQNVFLFKNGSRTSSHDVISADMSRLMMSMIKKNKKTKMMMMTMMIVIYYQETD